MKEVTNEREGLSVLLVSVSEHNYAITTLTLEENINRS